MPVFAIRFVQQDNEGAMPIYDYHCRKCDKNFELLVRGSMVPACPDCGSEDLEKQVSRPAPPGQSAGIISRARSQAAREGHLSNFSPAERKRS
jgi:putative FmdB family regulatory protein